EDLHAAAVVAALEGGVDLAPQRCNGLRHLPRFGLDLSFQFDRRVGEVVAFVRLAGGDGGDGQQQDERGCKGSANERAHGGTSIFPSGWGSRTGRQDQRQNMSGSWPSHAPPRPTGPRAQRPDGVPTWRTCIIFITRTPLCPTPPSGSRG